MQNFDDFIDGHRPSISFSFGPLIMVGLADGTMAVLAALSRLRRIARHHHGRRHRRAARRVFARRRSCAPRPCRFALPPPSPLRTDAPECASSHPPCALPFEASHTETALPSLLCMCVDDANACPRPRMLLSRLPYAARLPLSVAHGAQESYLAACAARPGVRRAWPLRLRL